MLLPSLAIVNTLRWPDYLFIALYFAVNLGIGWWVKRRKRVSGADYFLGGGRVPPWAAAVSWYGTAVSSVSMMALPAYAYANNWLPMIAGPLGSGAGFVVAYYFIGIIRRLNTPTIYSYLERRFSREVRLVVAGLAVLLKIFGRASVIMLLPALALSAATGINVYLSISLMGLVTTLYSVEGGFEAVVWTDVMQVAVKLFGVGLIVWYAAAGVDGGLAGIVREGTAAGKFKFVSWDFNFTEATVWVMTGFFIGYIFTLIADQPLMQRALAAKDERDARRTVLMGSILGFPSNALFFFVGTALFAFYHVNPGRLAPGLPNDAIVGYFISHELPHGIIGLIIAGIFAAAMSTLSSSLNSVAAIAASDFLGVLRPQLLESRGVSVGRWVTFSAGIFATGMALWPATVETSSIWDKSVRLLALFGGALPGFFALGMMTRRANSRGVIVGAVASIAATLWVQNFTTINSFFHSFLAFAVSVVVGYAASLWPRRPVDPAQLRGLTVWDLPPKQKASPTTA
ncbi:MAG: sodium/solute symporter [Undibacterium sp.]|nr:sodium/solute symporter [Opitutaceae bacterium]